MAACTSGDIWMPKVNVFKILHQFGNNLCHFGVFPARALPMSPHWPLFSSAHSEVSFREVVLTNSWSGIILLGLTSWHPLKCKWLCTDVSQIEWRRGQMSNGMLTGVLKIRQNSEVKLVWGTPRTMEHYHACSHIKES